MGNLAEVEGRALQEKVQPYTFLGTFETTTSRLRMAHQPLQAYSEPSELAVENRSIVFGSPPDKTNLQKKRFEKSLCLSDLTHWSL